MNLGLNNKIVLITGGSQGIGKATALSMTKEGAKTIICARNINELKNAQNEIKNLTNKTIDIYGTDVTKINEIENLFKNIIDKHEGIDILINNAGRSAGGDFENVTDDQWKEDLELKLFAAIRTSRIAIKYMKKQNSGRIINVTNLGGKAPGYSSVPTSVSRSAGIALTKAMSKDSAKYNILVNTVCIGLIKSSQHKKRWEKEAISTNISLEDWYSNLGKDVPLGRVGESSEAADVITFLASEKASYISGVAINIDGGLSPVV